MKAAGRKESREMKKTEIEETCQKYIHQKKKELRKNDRREKKERDGLVFVRIEKKTQVNKNEKYTTATQHIIFVKEKKESEIAYLVTQQIKEQKKNQSKRKQE